MQELELLLKVAQLYYEQGLTQNEIAKKLFISRSNISRLLTQAREAGIVEIKVHYPFERKRRIEVEFNRRFHLEEIRIVDLGSRSGFELYTATTKLAATYLNLQLNNDSVLAITCGNSVCGMVHELRPKGYLPGMQVVPMMGSVDNSNIILEGHYLVRQIAGYLRMQAKRDYGSLPRGRRDNVRKPEEAAGDSGVSGSGGECDDHVYRNRL